MMDRYFRIRSFNAMNTKKLLFLFLIYLLSHEEKPCNIFEQVKLHYLSHALGL